MEVEGGRAETGKPNWDFRVIELARLCFHARSLIVTSSALPQAGHESPEVEI